MTIELPEPAAHMYPSDLDHFAANEAVATAFSVAVGCPGQESVPLYTLSDAVQYAAAMVAEERNKWVGLMRNLLAAHDVEIAHVVSVMHERILQTLETPVDGADELNAIQALRNALAQVEKEA